MRSLSVFSARRSVRTVASWAAVVCMVGILGACGGSSESGAADDAGSPPTDAGQLIPGGPDPVSVVAVGDIVCDSGYEVPGPDECQHQATAELTDQLEPDGVIALGDLQYEEGTEEEFKASWEPSWGRFDDIIAPVPGNHEYYGDEASAYRSYFGTGSYYARSIGPWRIYLLDSNCDVIDCAEQAEWLRAELDTDSSPCAAIATHHSRVSSGKHGDIEMVQPLWQAAVEGGVDIALAGHDHTYERFGLLDAAAEPIDGDDGIRAFVIGTGGRNLYELKDPRRDGSEFGQDAEFGVLDLTLEPNGYQWRYVSVDGDVLDQGSDGCSP